MPADPRWQQIAALFDEALDRPRSERRGWLSAACDDEGVRREVGEMLDAHERTGVLERTLPGPGGEAPLPGPPLSGRQIGPYHLLEEIGQGGMGVVYKARDPRLDRFVALKFLPASLRENPELEARFRSEARAASALDHPNICTIYDIGETPDGQLYIAMAYYHGETLQQRIARGPLEVFETVGIGLQVADGLERAHAAGIVHRDVKPANLMLIEAGPTTSGFVSPYGIPLGGVKILDFGIAKLEGSSITKTGAVTGTSAYMSPEQLEGRRVDLRTDIWSLGVVLYEMLAGRTPYLIEKPVDALQVIHGDGPPPLRSLRPEVPPGLASVIRKAQSKSPDDRHASAFELAEALEAQIGS